ncbi:hypothetical protein AOL_s00004g526 [Orbilia oligospora ATCC 24927]|uniref:Uncharacterized protein n=1 Tax=Arthrobotrys oligospora (strain ATCC 24927 / CBS 115.81 / DSM 1491) TaxID=756982 RepID=G1WZ15_ARTOA|nr:hypothetical protein AOL_s00004g526 [Orbilia oligospora ATCC 24927]EGX53867.1 hypothetical protein AOL_s00004g526 [Orbilia oligospora ATCC 24927]
MPRQSLAADTTATAATKTTTTTTTSCPSPQSLLETIIRAYSLQDFVPGYTERQRGIVNSGNGDVTFSTPHETAINTFSALFSVAAAVRGRPGIPVERYGKDGAGRGVGEILREGEGEGGSVSGSTSTSTSTFTGEGKKVVKCYDEGFTHVKRIYNHVANKTGEQMDRLLDEVLKAGGEGYVPGCTSGDFRIELEAEDGEAVGCEGDDDDDLSRVISVPVRAPKRETVKRNSGVKGKSKVQGKKGGVVVAGGKGKKGAVVVEEVVETLLPSSSSSRPAAQSSKASTSSPSTVAAAAADHSSSSSAYAEIHLHRFIAISSIPYYKYLDLSSSSRLQFSDASSNSSTLPFPTVTYYALRIIQRWLYNPLRIGQAIEEFDPNAHFYLLSNCKRQDRNQYPPPLATAKGMIEVARAADYLGISELAEWSGKMLRKMCHGLSKCGGGGCRTMVPFVFDEIYKSGGMGLEEQLSVDIKDFLVRNVESMWKRPVVMLNDKCLEELVRAFRELHAGCGVPSTGAGLNMMGKAMKKGIIGKEVRLGKEEEVVTRPLHLWHVYLELNRVRVSVMMSASGTTNRWMEKLLGPAMEHCVHEIARGFNDPRLAADLASKMEDGSFQKDVVEEMLMMVSMSSIITTTEVGIPFEKAPLNRRTVKPVFEGVVNLRKFTGGGGGDNEELGKAEKRVLEFLGREWMTIVVGGEGKGGESGFAGWRPAMLTVLSRKLRLSVDDLLGKGARKGMAMQISAGGRSRGGRMVKDSFGNDVMVDSREFRRTEVDIEPEEEEGETAGGSSRSLRAEAEAFVPSGGVMGVDGESN